MRDLEQYSDHGLIAPPAPAYSNVTVRRAFIVWLRCGQANKFKDVCNYYHVLESLEEKMTPNERANSRRHELDLFINPPPTSNYLTKNHPNLYTSKLLDESYVKKVEDIKNNRCVFKLEGFEDIGPLDGLTKQEISDASKMVRQFCLGHYITLKQFALQFKDYTAKCGIPNTVENMKRYIKKILIRDELELFAKLPQDFDFLTIGGRRSISSMSSESSDFSILTSRHRMFSSLEYIPVSSSNSSVSEYNLNDYDEKTNTVIADDTDDDVFKDNVSGKSVTIKDTIKKMYTIHKNENEKDTEQIPVIARIHRSRT